MAWRLRAGRLAAGAGAGVVSASYANCHFATPVPPPNVAAKELQRKDSMRAGHMLFAIPKKGRLHERIVEMLKGSGFDYNRPERLDIAHCKDLPVSLVFLPAADIATYVAEGNVDLGITGEDIIAESGAESGAACNVIMKLGLGKCRLSVQAPQGDVQDVRQLAGKRIVTSFPELAKKFFAQHESGKPTNVKVISGSVEAACGLGLADGIVDLVETGPTMRAAGREEVAVLMDTQAVLISNPHTAHPELVETVRRRLAGYLTAQRFVMCTYNVHRDNLMAATQITPGKRSPSVMNLETDGWCAVSALVEKGKVASVMDALERIGATDILTTGLLSSRMGD